MGTTWTTIDTGNGESLSRGIERETDGTFTARTFTRSKNFRTLAGAQRWLCRAVSQ